MKRSLLIILVILTGVMLTACAAPATSSLIEVNSNLDAERVRAGMVYEEDFIITENYQMTFMKTVNCSDIHLEGNAIYYTLTDELDTPYFMWVCYPQITKDSRATVIAIKEDTATGVWTVIGVFRKDTDECLRIFGGTYGTKQAGW